MKAPHGVCITRDLGVVVAAGNVLWAVGANNCKTILAGKEDDPRSIDGKAGSNALCKPCGVAAEENTVFTVSPHDNALRMNTSGVPMANFLDCGRKQADTAGLLDPKNEHDKTARDAIRNVAGRKYQAHERSER